MTNWYPKIEEDISAIPDFIDYYEQELHLARKEVKIAGKLEQCAALLPSQVEIRFNQLQDIEAILEFLNIELRRLKFKHFKSYLQSYNGARALTDKQLEKFALGEPEIFDMESIVNKVALVRNQYLGIMKGLENKSFQLNNIVKLRTAGLDDAEI